LSVHSIRPKAFCPMPPRRCWLQICVPVTVSDLLTFIADNVDDTSRTLETGAGCSTLVFALRGSRHIAVTPSQTEISMISRYAVRNEILLGKIRFVQESSEQYLPQCEVDGLDLVLLDGKHAFPWPMLDGPTRRTSFARGGSW
jgi:hypothetical protein